MDNQNHTPNLQVYKEVGRYGDTKTGWAEIPTMESELAWRLIERLGLINATDNGEDSAGRHQLRLATVEETVARAFDIATLYVVEARRRGFLVPNPAFVEKPVAEVAEAG